jgi:hypothetical protein
MVAVNGYRRTIITFIILFRLLPPDQAVAQQKPEKILN